MRRAVIRLRHRAWLAVGVLVVATGAAIVPSLGSSATTSDPSIRLFSVLHDATVVRDPNANYVFLYLGVYAESVDGAFELDVSKAASGDLDIEQVVRDGDTVTPIRTMPNIQGTGFDVGLARFFRLRWTGESSTATATESAPFCPGGFDTVRTDDSGPLTPTYPFWCGGSLQTQATVWGIDRGWASQALVGDVRDPGLPDGTYTLSVSIAKPYADALGITDNTPVDLDVTLTTARGGQCGYSSRPGPCPYGYAIDRVAAQRQLAALRPALTSPGPLPDLRARPAWQIRTRHVKSTGRDLLTFAATVWNGGEGPMLVEGFRQTDVAQMPATQYFVDKNGVTGKQQVGFFVYDDQRGHHHWHFSDFARYELVNPSDGSTVVSGKRSFCIAPTDPVDLLAPGADWQPERIGLYSACGGEDAVWLREVLQAGWGDTYLQSRAGQAFNITHLPNGRYDLDIVANPDGNLIESDTSNNTSSVHLRLGGPAGARTVQILS